MSGKIFRITGSGFVKTGSVTDGHPVEFRHWREVIDEAENFLQLANSEEEEAVVELWLEDPQSFQSGDDSEDMSSVQGPLRGPIRRADNFVRGKQATVRASNWDQEFADAQSRATAVLSKLGNAR